MYGLVNRASQDMAISGYGESVWTSIKQAAGVEEFLAMDPHDDSITYALVEGGSATPGLPAEAVLRAFGEYWVLETAAASYSDLMRAAGDTLPECTGNLDQLHSRVLMTFLNLRPPSFNCKEVDPGELRVAYLSERNGLEPFVVGRLEGLAKHFNTPVDVSIVETCSDPEKPAEFLVRYGSALAQ